jgi:hypothetical protein
MDIQWIKTLRLDTQGIKTREDGYTVIKYSRGWIHPK